MLSISALSQGHQNYFIRLSSADYYLSGGEPDGQWYGKGAEALGRKGIVYARELKELFLGYLNGHALVQNAGKDNRQPGWDLCFGMPKSCSVTFALFPELRDGIRKCQEESVKYALDNVESTILFSRKGKGGFGHVPAKMVVALYEHSCSRALDPNLHTHCLIMNVGVQDDGTRALISHPLYEHKMRIGALYRTKLAELFEQRLGLKCISVQTWFEIEGISKELCDLFSTRRKQIKEKLDELGLETAAAAAFATLETRKPKTLVPPRNTLFKMWREKARARGFILDINDLIRRDLYSKTIRHYENTPQIATESINVNQHEQSKFRNQRRSSERIHKTNQRGDSETYTDQKTRSRRNRRTRKSPKSKIKRQRQTKKKTQKNLQKLLRLLNKLQSRFSVLDWSILYAEQVIRKFSKPRTVFGTHLGYEFKQFKRAAHRKKAIHIERSRLRRQAKQFLNKRDREIVRAIINNRGPIQILNIKDESKAHLYLRVCNEIWEKSKRQVWGFSLYRDSANELQNETGIRSRGFRSYQLMRHPTLSYRVKYSIEQLVREALFNRSYPLRSLKTKDKILVINDAHRLNVEQMTDLLQAVYKYSGRVVLIGHADFSEGVVSAFDHVAYQAFHNDQLKMRKDYISVNPNRTQNHEFERNL